jgi:putative phosphoribosyl transferase
VPGTEPLAGPGCTRHSGSVKFADRVDAGRQLAAKLRSDATVAAFEPGQLVALGLPRGGVPVAYEVATALDAQLDVILVRKIGVPIQPELAMGAIGEDGVRVVNEDVLRAARVRPERYAEVEARERRELERRATRLRATHPRVALHERVALVIDDGIATGSTARAACAVARAHGARNVILASPVAPARTSDTMRPEADAVVIVEAPLHFLAIGEFYRDFSATSEETVLELLARARARNDR